jgi:NAD(P)-dependent dehydrogenase (short-subunit alcohol dehydrogenase family)
LSYPTWTVEAALSDWQDWRVDGLINSAAIQGPVGPAWKNKWSEWYETLTTDLIAPVILCRFVVPTMLKHGKGKIVNLSGGGATSARPNYSAYATAKTGLVRFSECLAAELAGTGIDVNCVAPGKMPTGMLPEGETAPEDAMQKAADLVVFLLSDESDGITGRLISARWDDWNTQDFKKFLADHPDAYTLGRLKYEN